MHSSRHVHTKLLANFLFSSSSSSFLLALLCSDAEKDFFLEYFFDWMSFCVWWICYMQILSHYVREPHMVWNNVKLRDKTWESHAHIYVREWIWCRFVASIVNFLLFNFLKCCHQHYCNREIENILINNLIINYFAMTSNDDKITINTAR